MTVISDQPARPRLIFVTGPSGAGRSTAINVLEDLGFEAIDNLPLTLIPRLLDGPPLERSLALGVDVRNRDFSSETLLELFDALQRTSLFDVHLLFLDAQTNVLIRRYSETRRPHPMAQDEILEDGIRREAKVLAAIRVRAEFLIDTSELSPHDLRAELTAIFGQSGESRLSVSLQSFSYKRGVPRGVDMVFDCRFLRNPHWEPELRKLTGQSPDVVKFLQKDPRFEPFFEQLSKLIKFLLPQFHDEGKAYLTIGIGCTGGQHRSVAVAELLANLLAKGGWQVSIRHRELECQV